MTTLERSIGEELLELRKERMLHPAVEKRLIHLIQKLKHDAISIPEDWGVSEGNRADLVVYAGRRRLLHFEIFASANQVDRDLRILFFSKADLPVALIMDHQVDPRVEESYLRAVVAPERFPRLPISLIMDPDREFEAIRALQELIEEAERASGPLLPQGPLVVLQPESGAPFSQVKIALEGFHPEQQFRTIWDVEGSAHVIALEQDLDQDGAATSRMVVPHGGLTNVGPHSVRCIDTLGNSATAVFHVTTAWPPPSIRAVPGVTKPGETVSLVGGGMPSNTELQLYLWTEHQGAGIARLQSDANGEFRDTIQVPWLVGNLHILVPGRHKISISPHEGPAYVHAQTFIEVDDYSPSGSITWETLTAQHMFSVALIHPRYCIQENQITIQLRLRNDLSGPIQLLPYAELASKLIDTSQIGFDMRWADITFAPLQVCEGALLPSQELDCEFIFEWHRDQFQRFSKDVMGDLTLSLAYTDEDGKAFPLTQTCSFPMGLLENYELLLGNA